MKIKHIIQVACSVLLVAFARPCYADYSAEYDLPLNQIKQCERMWPGTYGAARLEVKGPNYLTFSVGRFGRNICVFTVWLGDTKESVVATDPAVLRELSVMQVGDWRELTFYKEDLECEFGECKKDKNAYWPYQLVKCSSDINFVAHGEIAFLAFEGGFWGLLGDDGIHYDLVNIDDKFKKVGLRVRVEAVWYPIAHGYHMWGKHIVIKNMETMEN